MSMDMYRLPQVLQERVMRELQPGEVVSWAGQPDPRRLMLGGFALWLFFIPWTAFSVFWIAGASGFKVPDFSQPFEFFPLFGLPFLLIGVGGLSSPFWIYRKARHMVYVITSKRAFAMTGGRSITVESWSASQLEKIVRTERPDGSGDLVFATEVWRDSDGDRRTRQKGFMGIADVRMVEAHLQRLAALK
ncbi:MAG: hypothetical protein WBJ03_03520 [Moraxellaceae bacterium]